ncbi:putative inactive purple acid phosphatase 1 [Morella rubra]|uniref:Putative inactive purple acid phosphatase 1 n=1 Tax=Morella rubra TaxID=262757 RepID=A0A6A1W3Q5_9ROSI|nr:putative inactive purple acid phosphatase 1 [Morella rubra]
MRATCPICSRETVKFRKVFEKKLSQEDIQGDHGAYIPKNDAVKLCGGQLANENGDSILLFFDVQNNPWETRLCRRGRKYILTGKWSQFVRAKEYLISEGRTVTFYRLSCPSCGENIGYTIEVLQPFGQLIIAERDVSNEYSNYQPGSLNTTDQLIKDLDNIDIVLHIGDITYANGYISHWDQFTWQVEPFHYDTGQRIFLISLAVVIMSVIVQTLGPSMILRIQVGNVVCWRKPCSMCPLKTELSFGKLQAFLLTVLKNISPITCTNVAKRNRTNKQTSHVRSPIRIVYKAVWYSTDFGMFHFCIADGEHDWREGSEQYRFIEHCLASADRQKQPWLIFAAHRVLGYSSDYFYGLEGSFAEPMGRESLQKLWQKYKVDLAFMAMSITMKGRVPYTRKPPIKLQPSDTEWSLYRDYDFGFVKLTAFNHSSLLFEYKKSRDGNVYDSFTITRDYKDVLACVHDGCEPTTLAT